MRLIIAALALACTLSSPAFADNTTVKRHTAAVQRSVASALCIDALGTQVSNVRVLPKLYIVKITTRLNPWSGIPDSGIRGKTVTTTGLESAQVSQESVVNALFALSGAFCSDTPPPGIPG